MVYNIYARVLTFENFCVCAKDKFGDYWRRRSAAHADESYYVAVRRDVSVHVWECLLYTGIK